MKKTVIVFSMLFIAVACAEKNTDKANGEVVSSIESDGDNEAAYMKNIAGLEKESQQEEKELQESITTLKFDKDVHDFGKINTGSENACDFRVTNTGTKPLIIYNVSASCGCTTPKKPEGPIPPGKSDVIKVGFKPNGPGKSEKIVTIHANTEPRVQTVKIKADVK